MHTHVARRFMHTPRLVLRSALRGSGKTTALDVLNGIVACPQRSDNLSAASFIRLTNLGDNDWGPTVLIDEVDNLGLLTDSFFRAALNSGYRQGGSIQRTIQNVAVTFKMFAPVTLAGIGAVPLPLTRDPRMPRELTGSQADNWRPLIAVAAACGVGEIAREVAVLECRVTSMRISRSCCCATSATCSTRSG
jgi:hypothetical protein